MAKLIKKEVLEKRIKETNEKIKRFTKNIENYNKKLTKVSKKLTEKEVDLNRFEKEEEYNSSLKRIAGENTYYDLCDYETLKEKIEEKEEKIVKLKKLLEEYNYKYENRLYSIDTAKEKREVPQKLIEFLEKWKQDYYEKYTELMKLYAESYISIYNEDYFVTKENLQQLKTWSYYNDTFERTYSNEKIEDILNEIENNNYLKKEMLESIRDEHINQYNVKLSNENPFLNYICRNSISFKYDNEKAYSYEIKYEEFNKILDDFINNQKDMFIDRIIEFTGEIKDLSDLKIGLNSAINGIVVGEKLTVKVSTILAGGYNIQRLHYRVLVKTVKLN